MISKQKVDGYKSYIKNKVNENYCNNTNIFEILSLLYQPTLKNCITVTRRAWCDSQAKTVGQLIYSKYHDICNNTEL